MKNFNKSTLFTLVTIIIITTLLSTTALAALQDNDFTVSLLSQDPDPVEPGDVVTIDLQIENIGETITGDVKVTIDPSYPLEAYGETEINLGSLKSGTDFSKEAEFELLVSDEAVEGDAEFDVYVIVEGYEGSSKTTLTVDISTYSAQLDISSVEFDPMPVLPGQEAALILTIQNKADSILKSISASLDFSADTTPFAAYQSSSKKTIGTLSADESIGLHYKIYTDPTTEPGLYKVPLTLDYEDNTGTSYSEKEYLTILVGSNLDIDVQVSKTNIWKGQKTGEITLEIANKGLGEIKSATITLLDSENYKVLNSQQSFYIGDIDRDDTESETITLTVNSRKDTNLNVQLTYLDSLNNEVTQDFQVTLPVYSRSEAVSLGIAKKRSIFSFIFLIAIIAGAYYYYKKKYLPKKKDSKKDNGNKHDSTKNKSSNNNKRSKR